MKYKMPIYETRKDTCVVNDVIKPYGRRVRVFPESERREAAFRFLEVLKGGKEVNVKPFDIFEGPFLKRNAA